MSRKRTDRRMVWICGGQFVCQKSGCIAFLRKGPVRPAKRFPPSEKIPAEGFGDKFGPPWSAGAPGGPNVAEMERFELSIPFWGIHDFQSCALDQLRDIST